MHLHTKKFTLKVFLLSTLIVILLNIWDNLLNASISSPKNTQNEIIFSKTNNHSLGKTWVAIATNIWISYKRSQEIPSEIYQEIFSIEDMKNYTNKSNDELLEKNMLLIKEYLNVAQTDVKKLINSSYDKSLTLQAYIDQLEFRYTSGVKTVQNLSRQRDVFVADMSNTSLQIENLKQKISSDFSQSKYEESLENIDEYLKLQNRFYFSRIYAVYLNHFISQYAFLNNYARNLAGVLISNKEAIIKDAYVVIPKTWWIEALKEFNLIYEQ